MATNTAIIIVALTGLLLVSLVWYLSEHMGGEVIDIKLAILSGLAAAVLLALLLSRILLAFK